MIKITTQSKLVEFLYNESNKDEKPKIQNDILTDAELGAFYYEMEALKATLDSFKLDPSENALNNIFNYSKSINLHAVLN